MKKRKKKQPTPPRVAYRFIRPDSEVGQAMYALMQKLIDAHHQEVRDARFALAWHTTWKADADGHVTLGQCKKVSELEREVTDLAAYDFVIVLRQEFWRDPRVTDLQRRALLDHELSHATVKLDANNDPIVNECGRVVYRLRKHDLEEFAEIADRYGCWKRDIEHFAIVLDRARSRSREWVGYSRLREQLMAAGASVPLDVIVRWTDTERQEAEVWALLQHDLQAGHRDTTVTAVCPEHVAVAMPAALLNLAETNAVETPVECEGAHPVATGAGF